MTHVRPGLYQHYKGGYYWVVGLAYDGATRGVDASGDTNEVPLVVYYSKESHANGQLCYRRLDAFVERITLEVGAPLRMPYGTLVRVYEQRSRFVRVEGW